MNISKETSRRNFQRKLPNETFKRNFQKKPSKETSIAGVIHKKRQTPRHTRQKLLYMTPSRENHAKEQTNVGKNKTKTKIKKTRKGGTAEIAQKWSCLIVIEQKKEKRKRKKKERKR